MSFLKKLFGRKKKKPKKVKNGSPNGNTHQHRNGYQRRFQEERKEDIEGIGSGKKKSKGKSSKSRNQAVRKQNKVNLHSLWDQDTDYKPMSKTYNESQYLKVVQHKKFQAIFAQEKISLPDLKKISWMGIPENKRSISWKLLLLYIPCSQKQHPLVFQKKQQEYQTITQMYNSEQFTQNWNENEKKIYQQIQKDVVRTQPECPMFRLKLIQDILQRILFTWHQRHPASGYVQGMNDICVPFLSLFILDYVKVQYNPYRAPRDLVARLVKNGFYRKFEADSYYCFSKLLDGIMDNYTHNTPGINKSIEIIKQLIRNVDKELYDHMASLGLANQVDLIHQVGFKWMACLLIREFPLNLTMRLFDTYISDDEGVSCFHTYVCATLFLKWAGKLKKMGFMEILLFFQKFYKTNTSWSDKDIELLIQEAYVYKSLFENQIQRTKRM